MHDVVRSGLLLLVLLNPFLVIVYLFDILQKLERREFASVLVRAALISIVVFCCFAVAGDAVFSGLFQTDFASFQIFGGVIFLLIGLQFVFRGPQALQILRGESEHLTGAIAMPVLIGPGTISASVVIGKRHDPVTACVVITVAVMTTAAAMVLLKVVHDYVRDRNEPLIQRYIEIAGRVTALFVGTVSIQMIMEGVRCWYARF